MCLYQQLIKNRKYTENKKNGGIIPAVLDTRTLYTPRGCLMCIECRNKKAREWQVRLQEDIKTNKNGKFITLTMSNESYTELNNEIPETKIIERKNWKGEVIKKEKEITGYLRDNAIATLAVRRFLERWRKATKKSVRHWLVTELGHNGTENIHLHGIIWTDETIDTIRQRWKYGWIYPRNEKEIKENYVNARTVNYITKYIYKTDEQHQNYLGIVLGSDGIGSNYTNTYNARKNKYNKAKTDETYRTETGHRIAIPIYYRNKIYTDEEKEKLWIEKLDKEERYILGQKISIKGGEDNYNKALKEAQKKNTELGYNNPGKAWHREKYETDRRKLMQKKRIQNTQ